MGLEPDLKPTYKWTFVMHFTEFLLGLDLDSNTFDLDIPS